MLPASLLLLSWAPALSPHLFVNAKDCFLDSTALRFVVLLYSNFDCAFYFGGSEKQGPDWPCWWMALKGEAQGAILALFEGLPSSPLTLSSLWNVTHFGATLSASFSLFLCLFLFFHFLLSSPLHFCLFFSSSLPLPGVLPWEHNLIHGK